MSDESVALTPHLLLPVSNHSKAGAGVDYVSRFFTDKADIKLTLMHIPPAQAAVWVEEGSYESIDLLETRISRADKQGKRVVQSARDSLIQAGFDPENISEKLLPPQLGKARDIIREARTGHYDAVVLGRRVQDGLSEIMDTSVCRELLEGLADSISFPLWVCRLPESDRKNILLCVDGSEPGLRMADHVGYMLSHDSGHSVTLFHVNNDTEENGVSPTEVISKAYDLLIDAGVDESRVDVVVKDKGNPARLIEDEYAKGGYAAVAIGSSGTGRGFWDRLFVGSVARTVFKNLHGAALWVGF